MRAIISHQYLPIHEQSFVIISSDDESFTFCSGWVATGKAMFSRKTCPIVPVGETLSLRGTASQLDFNLNGDLTANVFMSCSQTASAQQSLKFAGGHSVAEAHCRSSQIIGDFPPKQKATLFSRIFHGSPRVLLERLQQFMLIFHVLSQYFWDITADGQKYTNPTTRAAAIKGAEERWNAHFAPFFGARLKFK